MDPRMELLHMRHDFSELECIVYELSRRSINVGWQHRNSGSMMAESL